MRFSIEKSQNICAFAHSRSELRPKAAVSSPAARAGLPTAIRLTDYSAHFDRADVSSSGDVGLDSNDFGFYDPSDDC